MKTLKEFLEAANAEEEQEMTTTTPAPEVEPETSEDLEGAAKEIYADAVEDEVFKPKNGGELENLEEAIDTAVKNAVQHYKTVHGSQTIADDVTENVKTVLRKTFGSDNAQA